MSARMICWRAWMLLAVSLLAAAAAAQDSSRRSRSERTSDPQPSTSPGPTQTPPMRNWRGNVTPYPVFVPPPGVYYPGPYVPYPYPYSYPYSPYYLPPLFLPAETLYGPEAVKRFMGVDRPLASPGQTTIIRRGGDDRPNDDRPAPLRGTNRDSMVRAGKFVGYGDNHFAAQRYNDAMQRYRTASEVAPGLAEAHFRLVYAWIAMNRYEQAAKALKRGLDLDPGWPTSDFRNDEIYGDNQISKRAHLDGLAKAATDSPQDRDLLLLLGVFLYFDGQPERARPFFQRADQLGDRNCQEFLEAIDKVGKEKGP